MDAFLGKITQHAMNYAIRSGIGITATFAISQSSRLLKTVDNSADYQQLHSLQERLKSKIQIITPAINLIDLISSRGNTTLESAVTLTKAIRWDIQALGVRIAKAASAEESSIKNRSKAKSFAAHEIEIRQIIQDINELLTKIEDAVPLINLAITTSGASLSTKLPATVSPSRLLQASFCLNAGDHLYSTNTNVPAQVGPTFTLSLYMLFAGHVYRENNDTESLRDTTWKEVIHKARVKLVRVPLRSTYDHKKASLNYSATKEGVSGTPLAKSIEDAEEPMMPGEGSAGEFAYHLNIVEDLNDDRVHSFEDDEVQPGPYDDVELAGIREELPIYQISKIFYADTGKILNIGNQGETNYPVLLLKRDINAHPPRRMMGSNERNGCTGTPDVATPEDDEDDIDQQIRRESSEPLQSENIRQPEVSRSPWQLPLDLDPEWMAFEVYTEVDETGSEDEQQDLNDDSAYASHRPSSSGQEQDDNKLAAELAHLNLDSKPSPASALSGKASQVTRSHQPAPPNSSPFGPIKITSLSLLEMLIRLTALQQFQQASHLTIPDELLTFFLEESSTTGGDGDERRRTRREATRKVGFDPYDESPIKRRGEDYQYQGQETYQGYSRGGTPYDEYDQQGGYGPSSPAWLRERSVTPQGTPEPWLLRSREASASSPGNIPDVPPSSPISPYRALPRKGTGPLNRVRQERGSVKAGSPLGRGMSVETDSTLGTSPGSPTLVDRKDRAKEV